MMSAQDKSDIPHRIATTSGLRRPALAVLRRFGDRDVHIRHHYSGQRFELNLLRHKGYWYYGKRREQETMRRFSTLVRAGSTVFDVGAHIGYITAALSHLTGPQGHVVAFEPDPANRRYLKANTLNLKNVQISPVAISDCQGEACLNTESITGQNSSLLSDYSIFKQNAIAAGQPDAVLTGQSVQTDTIDEFCRREGLRPDFVKIDVEGAEILVLRGMEKTMQNHRPMIMVEVSHQPDRTYKLLADAGYSISLPSGAPVIWPIAPLTNIFALPTK